jgi:hypothetical protein
MTSYIDKKFINIVSGKLDRFGWKKGNLAQCRCPICGDSQKNKSKARGFFYEKQNNFFFKCFNCGFGSNIYNFMKEVDPSLCKEYAMEQFKSGKTNNVKKTEMIFTKPKFKSKHNLLKPLLCVKNLKDDHVAKHFVEMRKIPKQFHNVLYYTEDFQSYMRKVDPTLPPREWTHQEPRLIIPFFNKKDEVVAVQGRSLSMKDEANARQTLRYITVKADKSIERLWYGMWRANPKKRVYVVEGPIDSMFIPNTVAMVGAGAIDQIPSRFAKTDMVYALDNEPRNPQIVSFNQKLIEQGKTVCIWPNGLTEKDINDMIYRMSPKEIKKIMDNNAVCGLEAKMRLNQWRKV